MNSTELPEVAIRIVEEHRIFDIANVKRSFNIITTISGSKSELAALYYRADAIIAALQNTINLNLADGEVVSLTTTLETPQLDELHRERLSRRPIIPNRHF